ncbi:hypothetical protein [Rufibacter roseus]|uniref:Uncharacterized protein n=1 Tax=Rufibacter roseus TaxID=1567108 RepID=A0ABW2DP29_9BACT|nr:hypothetical protein [Rufibacter roseus]
MKYYSLIPNSAYPSLTYRYDVITMLADEEGKLTGQTLLEGHHTPEQLAEVESLGGVNYTPEEYQSREV